jgi:hypothetical protein
VVSLDPPPDVVPVPPPEALPALLPVPVLDPVPDPVLDPDPAPTPALLCDVLPEAPPVPLSAVAGASAAGVSDACGPSVDVW